MTKARRDGLILLLLGSMVFVLLGVVLENSAGNPNTDFRVLYYPARCLLQHRDPYNPAQVLTLYRAEGGHVSSDSDTGLRMVSGYVYLPNAFVFTLPFALLNWGLARILWQALMVASYLLAAYLIWDLAAEYAPLVAGALVCLLLANSVLLLVTANAAGIVIGLCAIAVWCFVRGRCVPAGVVCMAIALVLKPQDAGLVWLYFLLAGRVHRKRALHALLLTAALSLPMVLWVSHDAPNWRQEWHATMAAAEARGGTNDPGPASEAGHGPAQVISLQSALSIFKDDPHFYNPISYALCAALLIAWAVVTLRGRGPQTRSWLALAVVAALTMLPVYHRQYDAKLLLLTVPACAMLWAEGSVTGRVAMLVNATALVLTGDLTWALLLSVINRMHGAAMLSVVLQVFPAPCILLATSSFYLWIYARRTRNGGLEPARSS